MGYKDHKEKAVSKVNCIIITVSDTRNFETDISGKIIKEELEKHNHNVIDYIIVKDNPSEIVNFIKNNIDKTDAIILNGGTGISSRDSTYEAISSILEKEIKGFGEIFRYLSYKEIGSSAIMSRALAGVFKGKIIISIPGASEAVKLALEKLIIPEISHMVYEVKR